MPRAESSMPKKPTKPPKTINPNKVKTRDPLILAIIGGATKSGVHTDKKKEENRTRSRKRVKPEDEH